MTISSETYTKMTSVRLSPQQHKLVKDCSNDTRDLLLFGAVALENQPKNKIKQYQRCAEAQGLHLGEWIAEALEAHLGMTT